MKAVCYGEILWDVFDKRKTIGGATFNVAGHFSRLGDIAYMISAVGEDELGRDTLKAISAIGVDSTFIETVPYETGCAFVSLNNGIPSYSFNTPCAWDYIALEEEKEKKLLEGEYDVFVFGTLAQRGEVSHQTLWRIMRSIKAREFFFDVNLRLNYYSKEIIDEGLRKATILKVNDDEEKVIISMFGISFLSDLFAKYTTLRMIILTKGAEGSIILTREENYHSCPEKVSVVDTVGAGDSFSAAFLHFLIAGDEIRTALNKATQVASYVVQHRGAIPPYTDELKKRLGLQ